MKHDWTPVKDSGENPLEISRTGAVRWSRRNINGVWVEKLKVIPRKNSTGFLQVAVRLNGRNCCLLVHRMVATAFLPNPEFLPYVLHDDDDKGNNRVDNLYWSPRGRPPAAKPEAPSTRALRLKGDRLRERAAKGESNASLAKRFNIPMSYVCHVKAKRRWS